MKYILPLIVVLAAILAAPLSAATVPPFVPGSWTLALIPDTQDYTMSNPPVVINAEMNWLVNNKTALNLQMVASEGDVTNNNTAAQWANAQTAYSHLTAANIPYILTQGNHDIGANGSSDSRSTLMNSYFTTADTQQSTIGGVFEAGKLDNSYSLWSAGGTDYIMLSLEFGARDSVLAWANTLLNQYAGRTAMITTHAFLYSDSTRYDWATKGTSQTWNPHSYTMGGGTINDGQEMWTKLVSQHSNVEWVFNGHVLNDGNGKLDSVGAGGTVVHQLLANYQNGVLGMTATSGYIRLLEFQPNGNVQVKTYSPYLGTYLTDTSNQFLYSSTPTPPTPFRIAHWSLDEGSGQTVADVTGHGHDGFLGHSAASDTWDAQWSTPGHSGLAGDKCIRDAGSSSVGRQVRIADSADLTPKQITLSAWIKPEVKQDQVAVGKHNGGNDGSYYLGTLSTGNIRFMLITDARTDLEFPETYVDGNWHNMVGTYDGSTVKLYWDGKLVAQKAATGDIHVTSDDLLLGAYNPDTTSAWEFKGSIDDVSLFSAALDDGGVAVGNSAAAGSQLYTLYTQGAEFVTPEPATLSLLGLGAIAMLRRRK